MRRTLSLSFLLSKRGAFILIVLLAINIIHAERKRKTSSSERQAESIVSERGLMLSVHAGGNPPANALGWASVARHITPLIYSSSIFPTSALSVHIYTCCRPAAAAAASVYTGLSRIHPLRTRLINICLWRPTRKCQYSGIAKLEVILAQERKWNTALSILPAATFAHYVRPD